MEGKRFGKWKVLSYFPGRKPGKHYECECDCGNMAIIPGTTLRAGRSTRCKECMYAELFNPQKMIGKKFGNWTVESWAGNKLNLNGTKGSHMYKCVCDCGNELEIAGTDLRVGRTSKCKHCASLLNINKALKKNTKHGMCYTKTYKIWSAMLQRCYNSKSTSYYRYGGRGISVCDRWKKFENFLEDMGEKPDGLSIDRIDNNGNYEKANCRWTTHTENCRNRYY